MQVTNIKMPTFSKIRAGIQVMKASATHSGKVAELAAQTKHCTPSQIKFAKIKGNIFGCFKPLVQKASEISDSVSVMVSTIKKSSSIIRINKAVLLEQNPNMTKFQATFKSFKNIIPQIRNALREIGGVNDVKAAIKDQGVTGGVLEAGKAAVRVTASTGAAIAATLIPVPCTTPVGWVVGEKVANAVVGKPYTKKVTQAAKNIIEETTKNTVK